MSASQLGLITEGPSSTEKGRGESLESLERGRKIHDTQIQRFRGQGRQKEEPQDQVPQLDIAWHSLTSSESSGVVIRCYKCNTSQHVSTMCTLFAGWFSVGLDFFWWNVGYKSQLQKGTTIEVSRLSLGLAEAFPPIQGFRCFAGT